jgi:predicted Zn finger-like uncharacterized protein
VKGFSDRDSAASSTSTVQTAAPASCPACRSSSIVTTSKSPDADCYWRCTSCGEVWNDSRRHAARSQAPLRPWR